MDRSINQRLKLFVERQNISYTEFAKMLFINEVSVSRWFSLIDGFPLKHLHTLLVKFPNLDARWLITGEGDMYGRSNDKKLMDFKSLKPEEEVPPEILSAILMKLEDMRDYIIKLEQDKEHLRNIVNLNRKRKEIIIDMLFNKMKNLDNIDNKEREEIYIEMLSLLGSKQYDNDSDDVE